MMNWFRSRFAPTPLRTRLNVEAMEDRSVPASLAQGNLFDAVPLDRAAAVNVYTETNNPKDRKSTV